jgi:DNA-binding response OmpR family regulator
MRQLQRSSGKAKICPMLLLCIDDDEDDVGFFLDAVKKVSPESKCLVANNGLAGMNLLNVLKPDMIFIDINMPVMNGMETLRLIRSDRTLDKIAICMLSTCMPADDEEEYLKIGATQCFIKPTTFPELCSMIGRVLNDGIHTQLTVTTRLRYL